MALLAGVATPALRSAFIEQGLRNDAGQVALLVKTAMLTSREQQQPYLLRLEGRTFSLEPVEAGTGSKPYSAEGADESDSGSNAIGTLSLSHPVAFPDAEKKDQWNTLPSASWRFEPNGLCPLPRLRLQAGEAYIELGFDALTGGVEGEATYIP